MTLTLSRTVSLALLIATLSPVMIPDTSPPERPRQKVGKYPSGNHGLVRVESLKTGGFSP